MHEHATLKHAKGKPVVIDDASEVSAMEAVEWIAREEAAVIDGTGLDLPEEA